MYGPKLTRAYGVSVPDAWKLAINSLKQHELTRGLQRLLRNGSGSPPTLPQFCKACRELGGGDDPEPHHHPAPERALPRPEYSDPIHMHAQKCMFVYLQKHGAVSEDALRQMSAIEAKIVAQFCEIFTEDKSLTGAEIRDALFRAWDELRAPMPESEQQRHVEHFRRTGFAADWSPRQSEMVA